jgi:hypothetical protein
MKVKKKKDEQDKPDGKLKRVYFPKDSTAGDIADAIQEMQDEWAKKYPKRAHELYPDVYDEDGNRIKKD